MSITGQLIQSLTSALDIEVGGNIPGIEYDQLKVSGDAALNGTLNITLTNNFVPQTGDSFEIMTYGSYPGAFVSITPPGVSGMDWNVRYTPTAAYLDVVQETNGVRS